ncbi:peptide ABC transporter substrate-binding protein [Lactobacillus sp. YT155]|uniref:peptide ABC transporter substrate-binding protein n=1 Tax=Lactobacillus sp. YT155 TaxID=3060955 RepID=UPI00265EE2BD|nr:peptide ABC transporter substrate-binding protein [Lactobacillus sp. YT155]MDO1605827.1 peptide ABC transporter substrate-binding protein [Lactobacillus sp. YT155]
MKKLTKVLSSITALIVFVLVLAACGNGSKENKDTISFQSKDVIATMDSSLNTDIIGAQHLTNTMDGLYRFEGKKLVPGVAKKIVKPTDDGLKYTIPLKKTKWSNGDPVTANDFVFAWRRTVDPKTGSQYAYIFEGIKNAKEISEGKKPVDSLGIKAVDKYTLEVTLDTPIPYFDKLVSSSTFFPQNEKVVKKAGSKYGTNSKTLVFNGPFKLVDWKGTDDKWKEVKNSSYWNAKEVKLKTVKYQVVKDSNTVLNLFQSKKIDNGEITGDTSKEMQKDSSFVKWPQNSTFYLELNRTKNAFFKNPKFAQAISLAINQKEFAKVLGPGSAENNSFVPSKMAKGPDGEDFTQGEISKKASDDATEYNPTKAKKLWKEALAEEGVKTPLQLELLSDDTEGAKKSVEYLQGTLEKNLPGVKINPSNVPFKTRLSRSVDGKFDLVITAWNADFPDPINFLELIGTDNSYNNGRWSNAEFDNYIKKSKTTDATDEKARWNDLQEAQKIISEEQGVIPLYQNQITTLTNKSIKDLKFTPTALFDLVGTHK